MPTKKSKTNIKTKTQKKNTIQSLTITHSCTKTYSFSNAAFDKHLTSYSDGGMVKQLCFTSMEESNPGRVAVWGTTFEYVENLRMTLLKTAPIDIRLYVDSIEITDPVEKTTFMNTLVLTEYMTSNRSILKIINNNLSRIKKEQKIKTQVNFWLRKMTGSLPELSLSECQKIQKLFI